MQYNVYTIILIARVEHKNMVRVNVVLIDTQTTADILKKILEKVEVSFN